METPQTVCGVSKGFCVVVLVAVVAVAVVVVVVAVVAVAVVVVVVVVDSQKSLSDLVPDYSDLA